MLDSALSNVGLDLSESHKNGTSAQKQAETDYNEQVDETADATKSAVNQARESLKV